MSARMIAGYLEAAQWADAPEGSGARFTAGARLAAAAVCAAFTTYAGPVAAQALDLVTPEQFGHDLWLTRCGHGAGYWEREALKVPADALAQLQDRDGRPLATESGATVADFLTAAAYGTGDAISPFAYPDLCAYRGWLTFADSAAYALTGGPNVWPFWQRWTAGAAA